MLNIVLFQPEIPENTGNISRTCVGFNATLHMIRPFGFILNDKRMKRAGLDYWDHLKRKEYDDWSDFESQNLVNKNSKVFLITKFADKSISNLTKDELTKDEEIFFVFGRETKGLTSEIMEKYKKFQLKIEMNSNIRSFNLSNSVAIVAFHYHFLTNFNDLK
ncbi:tRNA (cytidine(34)-2'-O)-methyltransferase [Malacoplasma penetrans]|uniref:Putative tRNA (cytidine(34)-2'-O)-methyltransferase n=1 Tax=Malacoplasma penetrans (strain HF-2) TaxID=272633 RepID=Q8EX40_MALP2|nr:tRNA (cytidine(34)-2'-O)-methyltransferase [Malacoplasma penetrans]RXY97405.1 tRNA (cytidine(34)-2'-O)-methyltransferase [Malacoplasma penetrans]BAC43800.1 rRNA methylase [Malacoplasma penetrans HF-2]